MYPNNNRPNENQEETEELLGKEPSEFILGYLTCPQDAAKAFLGALMLTDFRARPLHFSFVSPVRPTRLQRILYGSTLNEHLKIDVIAGKLLKDIPQLPDVLFVDAPELLLVRRITESPTALLTKSSDSEPKPGKLSMLEYNTGSNIADQEIVGQILAALETVVDLIEPFTRMREALKEAIKSSDA